MRVLVFLVSLLLALPATADLWIHGCTQSNFDCRALNSPYDCCTALETGTCALTQTSGVVGKTTIRALEKGCWTTTNADALGLVSPLIRVTAERVRVCTDENLNGLGNSAVDHDLHVCGDGGRPGTNPNNVCQLMLGYPSQNCAVFDAGLFYGELVAQCPVGLACRMSFEGLDPQRQ